MGVNSLVLAHRVKDLVVVVAYKCISCIYNILFIHFAVNFSMQQLPKCSALFIRFVCEILICMQCGAWIERTGLRVLALDLVQRGIKELPACTIAEQSSSFGCVTLHYSAKKCLPLPRCIRSPPSSLLPPLCTSLPPIPPSRMGSSSETRLSWHGSYKAM